MWLKSLSRQLGQADTVRKEFLYREETWRYWRNKESRKLSVLLVGAQNHSDCTVHGRRSIVSAIAVQLSRALCAGADVGADAVAGSSLRLSLAP